MNKFFPVLMRALAGTLGTIGTIVLGAILGVFSLSAPSDISPGLWVLLGAVANVVIGFVLSLIKKPAPTTTPPA